LRTSTPHPNLERMFYFYILSPTHKHNKHKIIISLYYVPCKMIAKKLNKKASYIDENYVST
jgi:hypothetical protein